MKELNHFIMSIAGLTIEVNTITSGSYAYCINYLSSGKPDVRVNISEDDIQCLFTKEELIAPNANIPYLETLAVYHKIVESIINYNAFLMHGAVIVLNNAAFMFSAPSGTGKTTHIKLWLEKAKGVSVLNGDKPLIRIKDDEVLACGTPWGGKERLGTNAMAPLESVIFMERSKENSIHKITFVQAFPKLIQQTYLSSDPDKAKKTIDLLKRLNRKVSFWQFNFNNYSDDCFDVAYKALINNKNDTR